MRQFRVGDIVARRKGFVMHKGVVLADGSVLHNTPFRGEHRCSLQEFSAGRRVYRVSSRRGRPGGVTLWDDGAPPRGYNLFTNNCEHTASRVSTGRSESPQLQSWLGGVGLAALTFALTRHPGATAAGYALGRDLAGRVAARF